jgi:hypothetical protein
MRFSWLVVEDRFSWTPHLRPPADQVRLVRRDISESRGFLVTRGGVRAHRLTTRLALKNT